MHAVPPAPDELAALIRLLDDETPEVRDRVAERLALCGGDISEWLASQPATLTDREKTVLIAMLRAPRKGILEREWIVPTRGSSALGEDWDLLEALLRALSDFLHDGISLRQPLSDALDLLAEEASEIPIVSAIDLREFLFDGKRLVGNRAGYLDPRNSDLAWSIAEGRSNPLGLSLIFILTARRLELEVEGVNFPGHFMCRIFEDGIPVIVDCFENGRMHVQSGLLANPDLTPSHRSLLRSTADPGAILVRLLNNLHQALDRGGSMEDAILIDKLRATLE